MIFHQRFVPGLAIASYIIGDEKSGDAVVIDPTRDVKDFITFAEANSLRISHIVETHVHADFVSGARELKAQLNDEPIIHCSAYGGDDWTQPFADRYAKEGDTISIGNLKFEFRHVPGHTPEHLSVMLFDTSRSAEVPWVMFSGDFLFVGDVGRPDLLGEDAKQELAHQLYESVFDRLAEIPGITEVFPAHGAGSLCGKAIGSRRSSTVGFERRFNPSLQSLPELKWVENSLNEMPLSPPYFQRMKQVNKVGPAIIGCDPTGKERFSAGQLLEFMDDPCLVVDVRSKESFAAAHIPGAINIPFGNNLPTWAGWVLPYDHPILIIAEEASQVDQVVTHLLRVGFDNVRGYLEGGIGSWEQAGQEFSALDTMSVNELARKNRSEKQFTILDVRTEREWNDGHIDGAVHIHGGTLQDRVGELTPNRPVAVICGSGYRATRRVRPGFERPRRHVRLECERIADNCLITSPREENGILRNAVVDGVTSASLLPILLNIARSDTGFCSPVQFHRCFHLVLFLVRTAINVRGDQPFNHIRDVFKDLLC